MLIELFFYIISQILGFFAVIFPGNGQVPLLLPWGIDSVFSGSVGSFYYFAQNNWPVVFPMEMAVLYLGFELGLMLLKIILGSRSPVTT